MNLKEIKEVIESGLPQEYQESQILKIISKDQNAFNTIIRLLQYERDRNKSLIEDMNLELSRADVCIDEKFALIVDKSFVLDEIGKFYNKYKGIIGHCFIAGRGDVKIETEQKLSNG